ALGRTANSSSCLLANGSPLGTTATSSRRRPPNHEFTRAGSDRRHRGREGVKKMRRRRLGVRRLDAAFLARSNNPDPVISRFQGGVKPPHSKAPAARFFTASDRWGIDRDGAPGGSV